MSYDEEEKLDEEGVFKMDDDDGLDDMPEGFVDDTDSDDPDDKFH
ncbi:MAG: hypothetical protein AAB510_03185 [Patescibacteria group bacterium]